MQHNRSDWLKKLGLALAGIGLLKSNTFAFPTHNFFNKFIPAINKSFTNKANNMKLGAFSVSHNVKDINASKEFYEHLGFSVFAGDIKKNYRIMKMRMPLLVSFRECFKVTF